ncbi:MAG: hypothetical protein ACPGWR_23605 [Ardenticatenaceae bacterium]
MPNWLFLKDMQFYALAVGIMTLLFMVWQYRKSIISKELQYTINTVPLLKEGATPTEIEIKCHENVLSKPYVSTITVINTGTIPIKTEDYSKKLRFEADNSAIKLAKTIEEEGLKKPEVKVEDEKRITIEKTLMNPGDKYEILFISDGPLNIKPDGDIVGVSELKELSSRRGISRETVLVSFVSLITGLLLLAIDLLFDVEYFKIVLSSISTGLIIGIIISRIRSSNYELHG